MAAAAGGINSRNNRVGCFAKDDLHVNRQRSDDVLLWPTEERKISVQTHRQNTRQVLLQRHVRADNEKGGEVNGWEGAWNAKISYDGPHGQRQHSFSVTVK